MNRDTELQVRSTQPKPLSLDEVHDRIRTDALTHWDTKTSRHELRMQDGRLLLPHAYTGGHDALSLTSWATGQLCGRLGIPTGYYRKCPVELRDVQVNYWLQAAECKADPDKNGEPKNSEAEPQRWLLRADGQTLRGVLSQSYQMLDNEHLLDVLRPALQPRYRVDWFGLSDEALHLRIVDPALTRDVLPGDGLSAGVHISNSEVGKRSVTVDAVVYRLVCSNGLIRLVKGKSLLRQRHIHISAPLFEVALEDAVAEAVQTAGAFVEQMQAATKQPVRDVEKTLERLGIRFGLSQSIQEEAKRSMLGERADQQSTVYGLINGLTRAAQGLGDEERYGLETLAGRLLESGLRSLDSSNGSNERARKCVRNGHAEADSLEVDTSEDETAWSLSAQTVEMFEADVMSFSSQEMHSPELHSQELQEVVL